MKKHLLMVLVALISLTNSSCTDYLDISPESGLTEKDVFEKYTNFKSFFNVVYAGKDNFNIKSSYPLWWMFWDQKTGLDATTDVADNGRIFWGQPIKGGEMANRIDQITYDKVRRPVLGSMFKSIRIANLTLENVDRIKDASSPADIEDLRGQAHFVRAYCHFILMCYWGPMPYMSASIGVEDDWDIPRLPKHEGFKRVAEDLDAAYAAFERAGRVRRDPGPGQPGHLEDPDQDKPNGVAAKSLKARVLLYAASPLNNVNGTKDWEEAAIASWEAIELALKHEYALLPADQYTNNYRDVKYSNEQIWAWHAGGQKYNAGALTSILGGIFQNDKSYASGENPTQNMVDKFETKWGDPLNTPEDRAAATALGHYNEQDPYANRDPRFYIDVIYNQAPIQWSPVNTGDTPHRANIYYTVKEGKYTYATHQDQSYKGVTYTGYYVRKQTGDLSYRNQTTLLMTDPLIRLTELYLNYAEAANNAYGPTGKAPKASMSAVEAINYIRARIEMEPVLPRYTTDATTFAERIKNERTVELCSEGFHRFHDIRRWKDAPKVMAGPLYGMSIEKVSVSAEYPIGFKHTRVLLPSDRQSKWFDYMYYFPFATDDYFKLKIFDTSLNPVW